MHRPSNFLFALFFLIPCTSLSLQSPEFIITPTPSHRNHNPTQEISSSVKDRPPLKQTAVEATLSSPANQSSLYDAQQSHRFRQRTSRAVGSNDNMAQRWRHVAYFRMDPKTDLKLSQVDGNLCTHIILAFARIDSEGQLILSQEDDAKNYLSEVKEFKRKYPHIKLMISVFNEQVHNGFPRAARSEILRRKFARSAIEFLQQHNLDGIDLDWEFPNFPQTIIVREYERQGFTKILRSLRSAIVENFYDRQVAQQQLQQHDSYHMSANQITGQGQNNNQPDVEPYLLTVAIAGQEAVMSSSYELKEVANLCDWLNVMSYDYFQFKAYSPFTGPNSPIYPIVDHYVPIMSKLAHSWTYNRLINEETIAREKLVLGIPTYARAYRLMFKNSRPAPFTLSLGSRGGRIPDYLDYREVSDILSKPDTIVEFDARARVPYLLTDNGYTWVSYENEQSVREKVKFALDNKLGGYMTWNLNSDDFVGTHQGKIAASKQASQENEDDGGNENISNGHLAAAGQMEPNTFPLHRAMRDEVLKFFSSTSEIADSSQTKHNINGSSNGNGANGSSP